VTNKYQGLGAVVTHTT